MQIELQHQKEFLEQATEHGPSDEIDYHRSWVLRINQILQKRDFDDENSPLAAKKRLWAAQEQLTFVCAQRDKYIFELRDLSYWPWNRERRRFLQHRIEELEQAGRQLARITGSRFSRPSTIQTWSFNKKFARALTLAIESGNIPSDIKDNLIDAIQPGNLAITAGMFGALAAAHAFPVAGLAADITMLAYFGTDTALRAYRIYLEIDGAIDRADLRAAARTIEQEIAVAGSDKLIELLTWGAARSKAGRIAFDKTKNAVEQAKPHAKRFLEDESGSLKFPFDKNEGPRKKRKTTDSEETSGELDRTKKQRNTTRESGKSAASRVRLARTWQEHERFVTDALRKANPGANVGRQVTLDVTNTRTGQSVSIRIDNTVPTTQAGRYQLVEAKFSSTRNLANPNVNLTSTVTPNQQQAYGWISNGQPVTVVPRGQNAVRAGMTPGLPIDVSPSVQIHVNDPAGIVIRNY